MRKKGNDTNEHELTLHGLKVELRVLRRRRQMLRRAYLANLTVQANLASSNKVGSAFLDDMFAKLVKLSPRLGGV